MPETDNNEVMPQDELNELLKSLAEDEEESGSLSNIDSSMTGQTGDLQNLLDKNDSDLTDDDLENLVNMLNMENSSSETNFDDTYSDGLEEDENILNISADDLFSEDDDDQVKELDQSGFTLVKAEKPSDMFDQDDIDMMLSRMPVSKIDLTPDADHFVQNITTYDGDHPKYTAEERAAIITELNTPKEKKPLIDISKFKFVVIIINFFKKISGMLSRGGNFTAQKVPSIVVVVLLGVMLVVVVGLGFLLFSTLSTLNNIKTEQNESIMRVANDTQTTVNSSNFIYTSLAAPWSGWDFTLKKMLLDSESSMFYFDRLINLENVDVTLTDDEDKLYGLDLSYYSDTLTNETKVTDVLRFQPVPAGTTRFTLNIYDLTSKEVITFPIELKNPVAYMPVKYLEEPLEIDLNDDTVKLVVESAVFASSGTTISYKIEDYSSSSSILFAESEYINSKSLSITGNGKEALAVNNFPAQYSFPTENTIIGRMTFSPLASLTGNLTINLKNMFKKVTKNTVVDTSNLFFNKEEYQVAINSAPYKVVLERMGVFGTMYVLIYHAETASIVQKQMDESISLSGAARYMDAEAADEPAEPKTIHAKMSATLIVTLDDGKTIEIEGENLSNNIGGDIRFETSGIPDLPRIISKESVSVRINDISFKMPDTSVKLDLSALRSSRKTTQYSIVSNFLDKAFNDRLEIKSSKKDISFLRNYFTEDVINNVRLSEAYAPLAVEGSAQYSSQIISLAQINEKKYLAVVGVTWNGVVDGKEIHFYRTHRLIIEYISVGWRITRDEV